MNNIKNLLNLKKKDPSDIVIVEKIVLKNRSLFFELSRMLVIIAVASGIVWGISNADDIATTTANLTHSSVTTNESKNFSAVGTVSDIATTTISINNAKSGDNTNQTTYTFDTSTITKIESNHYYPLTLSQIQIGDNIIVQGTDKDGNIEIKRIIWYGTSTATGILTRNGEVPAFATSTTATSTLDVATTTASTTIDTASTTINTASSTETNTSTSSTDTATSTSLIDKVSNTVGDIVDKVKETVQNVIDTVTGTTTEPEASSTPPDSSSTPDTTVNPEVTPPAPTTPAPTPETPAPVETPATPPADPTPTQ